MICRGWCVVVALAVAVGCKGGDKDGGPGDGVDTDTTNSGGLGSFELDPTFGDAGVVRISRDTSTDLVLAAAWTDGGLLLAGSTSGGAHRREALLVKVLLDGSLDTGFGRGGFAFLPLHDQSAITDLEPLDDGGVVVAGTSFYSISSLEFVARLDASGELDPSFGDGGVTTWEGNYGEHVALARTSDGTLYTLSGEHNGSQLRRISADGALGTSFGTDGAVQVDGEEARDLRVTDDGKLLALAMDYSSAAYLHRLSPTGTPDGSFGQGGVVDLPFDAAYGLAQSPDTDELLVVGNEPGGQLLKLDGDGRPVQTFGTGGVVDIAAEDELVDVEWLEGGDIAVLEAITLTFPESFVRELHRLGPDGRPLAQQDGASSFLRDHAVLLGDADVLYVAGSSVDPTTGELESYVGALNADGTVDASFGTDGVFRAGSGASPEVLWDLARDPDDMVVGMGMAVTDSFVMRADASGPDPSFGEGGLVDTSRTLLYFNAIAVDDQGRTLGPSYNYNVTRLLPDGAPDEGFGPNGSAILDDGNALITDVILDEQQRIVVAGEAIQTAPVVLRALEDGSLDPTFGGTGAVLVPVPAYAAGTAVLEEPDGSLVLTGLQLFPSGIFLARLFEDGTLDPSFGDGGISFSAHEIRPFRLIARRGGGYLASGYRDYCDILDIPDCLAVVAFDASGQLDASFGSGGIVTVPSTFFTAWSGIVQLDDGRILIAGAREVDHGEELTVWALTAGGATDSSFGAGGVFSLAGRGRATSMLLDGDGVLVGGWRFTEEHGTDAVLLRLTP